MAPSSTEETPLIKAFGDAFDILIKSYERLPIYPRRPAKPQTMLFQGAAVRGKPRIGNNSLAKACAVFGAEVAALQQSLIASRVTSLVQAAGAHFAEGHMTAYELDILRNKALDLANRMEARQ